MVFEREAKCVDGIQQQPEESRTNQPLYPTATPDQVEEESKEVQERLEKREHQAQNPQREEEQKVDNSEENGNSLTGSF